MQHDCKADQCRGQTLHASALVELCLDLLRCRSRLLQLQPPVVLLELPRLVCVLDGIQLLDALCVEELEVVELRHLGQAWPLRLVLLAGFHRGFEELSLVVVDAHLRALSVAIMHDLAFGMLTQQAKNLPHSRHDSWLSWSRCLTVCASSQLTMTAADSVAPSAFALPTSAATSASHCACST